ncbi:hypothetical protein LSPCS325_19550 [Lysinibacillus sp. CTST325]
MKKDFFDLDLQVSEVTRTAAQFIITGQKNSMYPNLCPELPKPSTREANCSFIPPCQIAME